MSGDGRLVAIWRKRVKLGPMDPLEIGRLRAGRGLEGNANQRGARQVTLLSADDWSRVEEELGRPLDPRIRRANLSVGGLDLRGSRGRTLRIGSCHLRVRGETRPCRRMEEACPGLRAALAVHWRGGVYGEVLDDGVIRIGDPVFWLEPGASQPGGRRET